MSVGQTTTPLETVRQPRSWTTRQWLRWGGIAVACLLCVSAGLYIYRAVMFHQRLSDCFKPSASEYVIRYGGDACAVGNVAVVDIPIFLQGGGRTLDYLGVAFGRVRSVSLSQPDSRSIDAALAFAELEDLFLNGPIHGAMGDHGRSVNSHLQTLWLNDTGIDDAGLSYLVRNQSLTSVTVMHESNLTMDSLQLLGEQTFLKGATLIDSFSAKSANFVQLFNRLTHLEEVVLSGTQFDDEVLVTLSRLKSLRCVAVRDAVISDRGIAALASLPHLEKLLIGYVYASPAAIDKLAAVRSLKNLVISGDGLTVEDNKRLSGLMPWCDVSIGSPGPFYDHSK